jgi:hypothetical protein
LTRACGGGGGRIAEDALTHEPCAVVLLHLACCLLLNVNPVCLDSSLFKVASASAAKLACTPGLRIGSNVGLQGGKARAWEKGLGEAYQGGQNLLDPPACGVLDALSLCLRAVYPYYEGLYERTQAQPEERSLDARTLRKGGLPFIPTWGDNSLSDHISNEVITEILNEELKDLGP